VACPTPASVAISRMDICSKGFTSINLSRALCSASRDRIARGSLALNIGLCTEFYKTFLGVSVAVTTLLKVVVRRNSKGKRLLGLAWRICLVI